MADEGLMGAGHGEPPDEPEKLVRGFSFKRLGALKQVPFRHCFSIFVIIFFYLPLIVEYLHFFLLVLNISSLRTDFFSSSVHFFPISYWCRFFLFILIVFPPMS